MVRASFLLFVLCSLLIVPCYALDIAVRPKGFLLIPMGLGNVDPLGNQKYSLGGGGDLVLEIDFSSIWPNPAGLGYTLGVEGGFLINPLQNESSMNVNFYSFGGALGLSYFPLSRLFIRADGAFGFFSSTNERGSMSNPGLFWRAGGEIGFRFTPNILLAAVVGWRQYQIRVNGRQTAIKSGLYTGLTAQFSLQTGSGRGEGVGAVLDQAGAVYPSFFQLYQNVPVGKVTVRNNENAEIRDVRLYFRAGSYTSSEFLCGSVSMIARGRSAEIPLLADFSSDILRFTDTSRIIGEIVIRYRFLGREREVTRAVTVLANDRNRIISGDTSSLAAFISPSSPEMLDFARMIAGLERNNRRTGFNQNFSYALWLFEGLKNQITVMNDGFGMRNESAQFPAETLLFRSGSARDLALLFASGLESVGIGSALIQTENELLAAISLDISEEAAETFFNGTGNIIIIDNNVWLPLSMSVLSEGFMAAWIRGTAVLADVFGSGKNAEFVVVREAWGHFPPAPLPELGRTSLRINNEDILREVNNSIQQYIQQELTPIIQRTGVNTAVQQNRLGILLVRAGRIAEAKAAYERAAVLGSVPAMNNRGNLALIERDYPSAERWFNLALQNDSRNVTAQRGLERLAITID